MFLASFIPEELGAGYIDKKPASPAPDRADAMASLRMLAATATQLDCARHCSEILRQLRM
jgi:hypothetical protein